MALEKQLLLYDCRIGTTNSGNIYLDDLNTDYPMYKGPSRIGYLAQEASVLEN
jgi:ABC-type lipopolysaccharide export system ATPase subunit